jgi:hypothetical protein
MKSKTKTRCSDFAPRGFMPWDNAIAIDEFVDGVG